MENVKKVLKNLFKILKNLLKILCQLAKNPLLKCLIVLLLLYQLVGCSNLRTLKEETKNTDISLIKIERSIAECIGEDVESQITGLKVQGVAIVKVSD